MTWFDYALIAVVEPTVLAEHDLERLLDLAAHFRCEAWVVLNKSDLSPAGAQRIRDVCLRRNAAILAEIPFERTVPRLLAQRKLPLAAGHEVQQAITQAYERALHRLTV